MEHADLDRWVEGYVHAWATNTPEDVGALFTDGATYRTAPFREPWRGRQAIVEGWIARKDEPDDHSFRHQVLAVDGDLGFVLGWTEYPEESKRYSNLWVIRLTLDGRCSEFTEWWMEE